MKTKLTLTALALTAGLAATANAAIFFESFGTDDKGIIGDTVTPTSDFSGETWTITGDTSGLTATTDFFAVKNGVMEMQDLDGTLVWESASFSLDGNTSVDFSIDLGASGDFEASGDIFNVSYSIDGAPSVSLFSAVVDEDVAGDPMFIGSTQLSSTLQQFSMTLSSLTGANMQIFVEANNNAAAENYFFDNVSVVVPEPGTYALLAGFSALGFVMLRRRK